MGQAEGKKRASERVRAEFTASVRPTTARLPAVATTRDVSAQGIYLRVSRPIDEGAEVEVIFLAPPQLEEFANQWVRSRGKVIRLEEFRETHEYGIAVLTHIREPLPQ